MCIDVLKDNVLEKSKTIVDVTTGNINKKSIQSLIKINKLSPVVKEKKIIKINTFNVGMKIVEEKVDISSDNSKHNSKIDKVLNGKKIRIYCFKSRKHMNYLIKKLMLTLIGII